MGLHLQEKPYIWIETAFDSTQANVTNHRNTLWMNSASHLSAVPKDTKHLHRGIFAMEKSARLG